MPKNLLTAIFFLISFHVPGQDSTSYQYYRSRTTYEHTLLIGFNTATYTYAEIGYAFNGYGTAGHHPVATSFYGGSEIMIGRDLMIGPKVGFQTMGGLALGGSLIYYTNFHAGSLVIRPEFGVGMERFKMVYGYNFSLTNKDFDRFNRHLFGFTYLISVKTIKN
jgi:hypothetical protein